jgi:cytidylate kinase
MPAHVICISRTFAAGGEDVGRRVAEALGFRYVDEEIVEIAAEKAGLDHETVADAEKRRTLAMQLLEGLAWSASATMTPTFRPSAFTGEAEAALIRTVIGETYELGDAVIVAHAASIALAGRAGVLRVLVTAPPEVRSRRAAESAGVDGAAGAKLVRDSDRDRAAYLKRFYGLAAELPTHYDLVVNSEFLSPEEAAALVVQASRS